MIDDEAEATKKVQHAEGEEGVLIQLMAEPRHMRRSRHEGTRDAFDHPAVKTWRGLTVHPYGKQDTS